jgi:FixJ family two-component response regulator
MEHNEFPAANRLPIHFVERDVRLRAEMARIAYGLGHHCELYSDLSELAAHPPRSGIVVARDCPETGGISMFLEHLLELSICLPVIGTETEPHPSRIVAAIKAGAIDYLALPLNPERFSRSLARVSKEADRAAAVRQRTIEARERIAMLSGRERQVLEHLVAGRTNKLIARELEISPRTVEIHRANMMSKLGASQSAEAVRLRLDAQLESLLMG